MIQNNYTPNFCGIPVRTLNITQITKRGTSIVPAIIEQISSNCSKDVAAIEKIAEPWSLTRHNSLIYFFKREFMEASKNIANYCIKAPNKEILGIIQTTSPTVKQRKIFKIEYLITKPYTQANAIKYKGVGTAGLLHVTKTAQENGFKRIRLFSSDSAIKFYEKLGLKRNSSNAEFRIFNCFDIPSKDFSSFISNKSL